MADIDFLPLEYRQQNARRQAQPWRLVVAVLFVAMVGIAASGQWAIRRQAERRLATMAPLYEDAMSRSRQVAELQADLQKVQSSAELITYLRHPWPRTQLLSAVAESLPPEITLQQLQIVRDTNANPKPADTRSTLDKQADEEKAAKLPPAQRDLKRLKEEIDRMPVLVRLTGVTNDTAALHHYLGALARNGLFAKTEIRSIESDGPADATSLRFQVALMARPGHGQSGGPAAETAHDHPKTP